MIFENIDLTRDDLRQEQKTKRFARVMNEWKKLSEVSDEELVRMLEAMYQDDKGFTARRSNQHSATPMPGFRYYREEARIIYVFTKEAELMARNRDSPVEVDDIIALYLAEIEGLKTDHNYYQHQNGKTNEYTAEEQQDGQIASDEQQGQMDAFEADGLATEDVLDLPFTEFRSSSVERELDRKMHEEWLMVNFPFEKYKGVLDGDTISELLGWLTYTSQNFAERFFQLDAKSAYVFCAMVFRGMKGKQIAEHFRETPGAISKRWKKTCLLLFGQDKRRIKDDRSADYSHWEERRKRAAKQKKELAREQKVNRKRFR